MVGAALMNELSFTSWWGCELLNEVSLTGFWESMPPKDWTFMLLENFTLSFLLCSGWDKLLAFLCVETGESSLGARPLRL